jgi:ankyrin repeat protein
MSVSENSHSTSNIATVQAELNRLQTVRQTLEHQITTVDAEIELLARAAYLKLTKALRKACIRGDLPEIERLLNRGADVNARNKSGATPLLLAVHRDGNMDAVHWLLKAGADVNKADFSGNTPLIAAVRPGELQTVATLVEHRASINVANSDGDTPLTNAATWGSVDVVRYLLQHGADPLMTDGVGLLAADLARQHGHAAIVLAIENVHKG